MIFMRKFFKQFFIGAVSLVIVTVIGGRIYQIISESRDLARFPAPGKLVDVDGHLMHIHCQGEGSPTVVVEQGLQGSSALWDEIHQKIALGTRVCAYDRAGLGYSEPLDHPIRATEVAERLHTLLRAAEVEDDLILVGWSAGGLYIREFYRQYPEKVRAMLFVDSSHEQQEIRIPQIPASALDFTLKIAQYFAPIGLVRLSGGVNRHIEAGQYSDELKPRLKAIYNQSHIFGTMFREFEAFKLDKSATQPPAPLGDVPLIVLSQGKPVEVLENVPPHMTLEFLKKERKAWDELQQELVALSSRGKQIIATESGHSIHLDQPDLLVESINELVQLVRVERDKGE